MTPHTHAYKFNKRIISTVKACVCLGLASLSFDALSENMPTPESDPSKTWRTGLTLDFYSFDDKAAAEQGIDSSAVAFGFEGRYFFNANMATTIGMQFLSYDDNEEFQVLVQNQSSGDISTEGSSASAIPLYGEMNYVHQFGTDKIGYIAAGGGFNALLASGRDIAYCSDCPEDSINIDGGLYANFEVAKQLGETWGLGLSYKQYLSGDINSVVTLDLIFGF